MADCSNSSVPTIVVQSQSNPKPVEPIPEIKNPAGRIVVSPRSWKKSFASVVSPNQTTEPIIAIKDPTTHDGLPAVKINADEHSKLCAPHKFALIGAFSYSRPPLQEIRNFFANKNFKGQVDIGLLNSRQILIRPSLQEDYIRIWEKRTWTLNSSIMRVLKWSPRAHTMQESSIAPVWISLPKLPIQFFEKSMLFAIASTLGNPLKVDDSTASLSRPSVARILIEIDIDHKLANEIWIGVEEDGFRQAVMYENVPFYCVKCFKMGHTPEKCRLSAQIKRDKAPPPIGTTKGDNIKQIFVPKKVVPNQEKGKEKTSSLEIVSPSVMQIEGPSKSHDNEIQNSSDISAQPIMGMDNGRSSSVSQAASKEEQTETDEEHLQTTLLSKSDPQVENSTVSPNVIMVDDISDNEVQNPSKISAQSITGIDNGSSTSVTQTASKEEQTKTDGEQQQIILLSESALQVTNPVVSTPETYQGEICPHNSNAISEDHTQQLASAGNSPSLPSPSRANCVLNTEDLPSDGSSGEDGEELDSEPNGSNIESIDPKVPDSDPDFEPGNIGKLCDDVKISGKNVRPLAGDPGKSSCPSSEGSLEDSASEEESPKDDLYLPTASHGILPSLLSLPSSPITTRARSKRFLDAHSDSHQ